MARISGGGKYKALCILAMGESFIVTLPLTDNTLWWSFRLGPGFTEADLPNEVFVSMIFSTGTILL